MSTPDGPLHTFQARVRRRGEGEWIESAPSRCPTGCDLTRPGSVLVGWNSAIDPPHRTWTCRRCGTVIHNLDPAYGYLPMRPVRLDHRTADTRAPRTSGD